MSTLYAGLDVSLEQTSVCVINAEGTLIKEAKVPTDPPSIIASLSELEGTFERIGLEAGLLSQWLYFLTGRPRGRNRCDALFGDQGSVLHGRGALIK